MASKRKKSEDNASEPASESGDEDPELTEKEYTVDCILYEEVRDGEMKYLIKWKDYPLEESTWEPTSSFTAGADAILARWEEDKKRIEEGFKDPLDLDDFDRQVFMYQTPGVAVPALKKQKTSPSSGKSGGGALQQNITSEIFVGESDSGDDMPLRQLNAETGLKKSLGCQLNVPKPKSSSKPESDHRPLKCKETTSAAEPAGSKLVNGKSESDGGDSPADDWRKRKASPGDAPRSPLKKTKLLPVASIASTKPALGVASKTGVASKAATSINDGAFLAKDRAAKVAEALNKTQAQNSASKPSVPAQKVFGNADPVKRTRKLAETGKIYSPSHIQNIIRLNQDGVAPDPSTLVLQNPADMSSRPLRHQDSFSAAPTTPLSPRIFKPPIPRPPEVPREVAPYAQSIPLTCAYVHDGRICPEGAHQCRFLHEKDPEKQVADYVLHQQARDYKKDPEQWPKFNSRVIVCTFQFKNPQGCFREEKCFFAHWKPLKGGWEFHLHKNAERKTCPYWAAKEGCWKTAEQCEFAHEMLPEMADFGEKARLTCPFWYANQYEGKAPCTKGINCTFAHELTPTIAYNPRTKTGPRQTDPALLQAGMNQRIDEAAPEALHIDIPPPPPPAPPAVPQMVLPLPHADQGFASTPPIESPGLETFELPFTESEPDMSILDQIDTSTMFGLTLDTDEMELKIYMEIYSELLAYLNEYWPEDERVVEPKIVPFDDVTGIILEVYSDKLETGRLHPMDYEFDLAELADHLAHEDSALTIQFSDMILLLYPSRGDVDDDNADPPDSAMAFEIRTVREEDREFLLDAIDESDNEDCWSIDVPDEDIEDKQDDQIDDEASSLFFKTTFDLDFEDLFKWPTGVQPITKEIFVLIDEDREIEMRAFRRLLNWCGAGTAQPNDEGSWEEFKHKNEGVVIIDERYTEYHDLPYLSHLLLCRYNFFELRIRGENLQLHQLFRSGQTIFLTDQVLEDEPALALSVVEYVKERNKNKLPGTESRRIFARPGVIEWLGDLAGSSSQEDDPVYESRAALWNDVASLLPNDSPTETTSFTDRVIYEPTWITGHNSQYMEDPDAATEALLQAFHVTFLEHREASRNWIVLHRKSEIMKKQAEKWSEAYHNLRFMTVEDFQTKVMGR